MYDIMFVLEKRVLGKLLFWDSIESATMGIRLSTVELDELKRDRFIPVVKFPCGDKSGLLAEVGLS